MCQRACGSRRTNLWKASRSIARLPKVWCLAAFFGAGIVVVIAQWELRIICDNSCSAHMLSSSKACCAIAKFLECCGHFQQQVPKVQVAYDNLENRYKFDQLTFRFPLVLEVNWLFRYGHEPPTAVPPSLRRSNCDCSRPITHSVPWQAWRWSTRPGACRFLCGKSLPSDSILSECASPQPSSAKVANFDQTLSPATCERSWCRFRTLTVRETLAATCIARPMDWTRCCENK